MWASVLVCVFPACRSNPCQNEGTCRLISSTGQEVCNCRYGYSGPHCSIGEWGMGIRCTWWENCRWGHEQAAKVALSSFKIFSLVQRGRYFIEGFFELDFTAKGRRYVICVSEVHFRMVSNDCVLGCACRAGLGVLQQQRHRLQRGGKHHSLRRTVSSVELGPAV